MYLIDFHDNDAKRAYYCSTMSAYKKLDIKVAWSVRTVWKEVTLRDTGRDWSNIGLFISHLYSLPFILSLPLKSIFFGILCSKNTYSIIYTLNLSKVKKLDSSLAFCTHCPSFYLCHLNLFLLASHVLRTLHDYLHAQFIECVEIERHLWCLSTTVGTELVLLLAGWLPKWKLGNSWFKDVKLYLLLLA